MDKRKVIHAYRRGFITMKECAQILGIDSAKIVDMVDEGKTDRVRVVRKQPVNGC